MLKMENTDTSFMVTGVIPDTPAYGYAVCSMPEFLLVRRCELPAAEAERFFVPAAELICGFRYSVKIAGGAEPYVFHAGGISCITVTAEQYTRHTFRCTTQIKTKPVCRRLRFGKAAYRLSLAGGLRL